MNCDHSLSIILRGNPAGQFINKPVYRLTTGLFMIFQKAESPLLAFFFQRKSVTESHGSMRTVAKRFIGRLSATAQSHPVPDCIAFAIRTLYADTAFYPDRSAHSDSRILNNTDRGLKRRFEDFLRLFVPNDEPPGRTMAGLATDKFTLFLGFSELYQIPDSTACIAETGKSTILFVIGKHHGGAFQFLGFFK